jgi:membrane-associated protein
VVAGFSGDALGYSLGNRMGPRFYKKKDTWYFKKSYLDAARNYFVRHKRRSILFGKFLPVIRPFTPLLSGISRIQKPAFLLLSFVSVLIYISFFLLLGYFLGNKFPSLQNYLGWILPISILTLLIPTILQIRKNRSSSPSV